MAEQLALRWDPEPTHDPAVVAAAVEHLARALASHLARGLGEAVRLYVTENHRRMLSARRLGGRVHVRIHRVFLGAETSVWDAVVAYLQSGGAIDGGRIGDFLAGHRETLARGRRIRRPLRAVGTFHDLGVLLDGLRERYFDSHFDARITWGVASGRSTRPRSIQLGAYLPDEGLIRIHPSLDQPFVPAFYVESVIFHEMLHHALPGEPRGGGRRVVHHGTAFRALERSFEHHEAARTWERENLHRLAGPARRELASRRGASLGRAW